MRGAERELARLRTEQEQRSGGDEGVWREIAASAVIENEARGLGFKRPQLAGRLIDPGDVDGETLEVLRENSRGALEALAGEAPELLDTGSGRAGLLSPGGRGRMPQTPKDENEWLRKAGRR